MTTKEENAQMDLLKTPIDISYREIQACGEFQRIANKLGTFFARPIPRVQIEECIRDNAIAIYPLEKVEWFMDTKAADAEKLAKKTNQYARVSWNWHPLRAIDRDRPTGVGNISRIYEKPVPVEVMMTAEKLADSLGPGVRFYVADLVRSTIRIDPFLSVTAHGCPLYVIERWDEPTFRL